MVSPNEPIQNHKPILCHHFEIEGEALMIVSHDSGEPNTYNEAIGSFAKELWMEEKMESINVNHV